MRDEDAASSDAAIGMGLVIGPGEELPALSGGAEAGADTSEAHPAAGYGSPPAGPPLGLGLGLGLGAEAAMEFDRMFPEGDGPETWSAFEAAARASAAAVAATAGGGLGELRSLLPRTSPRPYNRVEPGRRYLAVNPSGGFNNQLHCLLSAAWLAKRTNRTLLVMPAARHSSMSWVFMKLEPHDMIPMDHVLDLPFLERALGVEMQPLSWTLRHFYDRVVKRGLAGAEGAPSTQMIDIHKDISPMGLRYCSWEAWQKLYRQLDASQADLLYLHGRFYNKQMAYGFGLFSAVRYSPYLRELARRVVAETFPRQQPFNAMHVRLGDYKRLRQLNSGTFVAAAARLGLDRDAPLYVASDAPSSDKFFLPLLRAYKHHVFMADLTRDKPRVTTWFKALLLSVPKRMRNDLVGIAEQLIAAQAQRFLGSEISTFSKTIALQRKLLNASCPEYAPVGPSALVNFYGKYVDGADYGEFKAANFSTLASLAGPWQPQFDEHVLSRYEF
jgi:hypothetical protein